MLTEKRLSPQQVKFCHEYLVDSNPGYAAIRAGYKLKAASSKGSRLLRQPQIKAYIEQLQAELREKYKATAERVLHELGLVAFSDFGDYMTVGNEIVDITQLPEHKRRAVSSVQITYSEGSKSSRTNIHLKMHDKIEALRLLGKQFGILERPLKIRTQSQTQTISIRKASEAEMLNGAGETPLPAHTTAISFNNNLQEKEEIVKGGQTDAINDNQEGNS